MSSVRILVVDDFEPFRRFICNTLAKRPNLQVVGEVSDGAEAVKQAQKLQPDLIFLDIGLPTLNGIAAGRQIRALVPKSKIIFVTQELSPDLLDEAVTLGASGYVLKSNVGSDLLAAVDAVLKGKKFLRGEPSD